MLRRPLSRIAAWAVLGAIGLAAVSLIASPPAWSAGSPNVWVSLTTEPVDAQPGDKVTHSILVGVEKMAGKAPVELLFTTTVPLENATAETTSGTCQVSAPTAVTCTVDADQARSEPITISITGIVSTSAQPGTVVYNSATVGRSRSANADDSGSANDYVLTRAAAPSPKPSPAASTAASPSASAGGVVPASPASPASPAGAPEQPPIDDLAPAAHAQMPQPWPAPTSGGIPTWLRGLAKIAIVLLGMIGGVFVIIRQAERNAAAELYGWRARGRHRRRPRQRVAAAEVIGLVGPTGASTGPRLGFEARRSGRPVDPVAWS